jgi:hypothetical protein
LALSCAAALLPASGLRAQEYTFTTLAGPDEDAAAIDGTGSSARFKLVNLDTPLNPYEYFRYPSLHRLRPAVALALLPRATVAVTAMVKTRLQNHMKSNLRNLDPQLALNRATVASPKSNGPNPLARNQ